MKTRRSAIYRRARQPEVVGRPKQAANRLRRSELRLYEDKDYGYIVDFKKSLGGVQQTLAVDNSDEVDTDEGNGKTNNITLKDKLVEGKKKLDNNLQSMPYLCGPVPPPREIEQYLHYSCGDGNNQRFDGNRTRRHTGAQ